MGRLVLNTNIKTASHPGHSHGIFLSFCTAQGAAVADPEGVEQRALPSAGAGLGNILSSLICHKKGQD